MSALSAVPPLLLSREEVTGLPLKRAFCALHTWDRNCSVVDSTLRTECHCFNIVAFASEVYMHRHTQRPTSACCPSLTSIALWCLGCCAGLDTVIFETCRNEGRAAGLTQLKP